MANNIVIGADPQPDAPSSNIVMGTTPSGSTLLDFIMPFAPIGSVLLIAIVRNQVIDASTNAIGWTKLIDGSGAAPTFLDVWVRTVDKTPGSRVGDVVSFLSVTPQELQGTLVILDDAKAGNLVVDVQSSPFAADVVPPAPIVNVLRSEDTILCLWSAGGSVGFAPPSGFSTIDTYTSAIVSTRSLMVARRTANFTFIVDPGSATASPAATGRAFTLSLAYIPNPRRPLLNVRPNLLGGLLDQYIDPITLDYVDTDDGEWLDTPDSRTLVMIALETRFGKSYSAPADGTRVRDQLESGEPVTPQFVQIEITRMMQTLERAGVLTAFSMALTDAKGDVLVDQAGRFSPQLRWLDLATGSPVDLVYTAFGAN
jgi:hypothetical protein